MAKGTFSLSNIQVGGRVGDLLFLPQKDGRLVVQRTPTDLPPRTALQDDAAERMRAVAAVWHALSFEEAAAWEAYVREAQAWPLPAGGKIPTQAYGAFLGLSTKRLQMRPEEPVPTLPPTEPFLGDGVGVTMMGSLPMGRGRGGVEGVSTQPDPAEPQATPTLPSPKGEATGVTFAASAPNAPGTVTELLLQPLAGKHRKPTAKGYRTQAFVAFAPGALTATLDIAPGAYAGAVRFVREATGQETGIIPIGKVLVG